MVSKVNPPDTNNKNNSAIEISIYAKNTAMPSNVTTTGVHFVDFMWVRICGHNVSP